MEITIKMKTTVRKPSGIKKKIDMPLKKMNSVSFLFFLRSDILLFYNKCLYLSSKRYIYIYIYIYREREREKEKGKYASYFYTKFILTEYNRTEFSLPKVCMCIDILTGCSLFAYLDQRQEHFIVFVSLLEYERNRLHPMNMEKKRTRL